MPDQRWGKFDPTAQAQSNKEQTAKVDVHLANGLFGEDFLALLGIELLFCN